MRCEAEKSIKSKSIEWIFGAAGALLRLVGGTSLVFDNLLSVFLHVFITLNASTREGSQSLRNFLREFSTMYKDWIFQFFFNQIVQSQKPLTKSKCQK